MRVTLQMDSVRDARGLERRNPKDAGGRDLAKLIGKTSLIDEPHVRKAQDSLRRLSVIPDKQRGAMQTDELLGFASDILAPLVKEKLKADLARRTGRRGL